MLTIVLLRILLDSGPYIELVDISFDWIIIPSIYLIKTFKSNNTLYSYIREIKAYPKEYL